MSSVIEAVQDYHWAWNNLIPKEGPFYSGDAVIHLGQDAVFSTYVDDYKMAVILVEGMTKAIAVNPYRLKEVRCTPPPLAGILQ